MAAVAARSRTNVVTVACIVLLSAATLEVLAVSRQSSTGFNIDLSGLSDLFERFTSGNGLQSALSEAAPMASRLFNETAARVDRLAQDGEFYDRIEAFARAVGREARVELFEKDGAFKYVNLFEDKYWGLRDYFAEEYLGQPPSLVPALPETRYGPGTFKDLPVITEYPPIRIDTPQTPPPSYGPCDLWSQTVYYCNGYVPPGGGGGIVPKPPSPAPEPATWMLDVTIVGAVGAMLRHRRRRAMLKAASPAEAPQ